MHVRIREIIVQIENELGKWDSDDRCANHLQKLMNNLTGAIHTYIPDECEFRDKCIADACSNCDEMTGEDLIRQAGMDAHD